MKSRTLQLIGGYMRVIQEQGEDPAMMAGGDPNAAAQPPTPTPAEQQGPPEPLKMTQQGENSYIKTIFELSKLYLDAIGNQDDKEEIDAISNSFDDAIKEGQVNGREYMKQYNKIMIQHMPDEMRSLLGVI